VLVLRDTPGGRNTNHLMEGVPGTTLLKGCPTGNVVVEKLNLRRGIARWWPSPTTPSSDDMAADREALKVPLLRSGARWARCVNTAKGGAREADEGVDVSEQE